MFSQSPFAPSQNLAEIHNLDKLLLKAKTVMFPSDFHKMNKKPFLGETNILIRNGPSNERLF